MGNIRQTKYSGNRYWTDVLFHNSEGPGSSPALAIELTVDGPHTGDFALRAGEKVWFKFTPTYSDYMDFWIFSNGLYDIPNDISYYASYEADHTTQVDIGTQVQTYQAGGGPDQQGRDTWFAFLNYQYQDGQTYYVTFVPPFTGNYGFFMQGD
jgi:hypothetical protein